MPPLGSACAHFDAPTVCAYQPPECANTITVTCTYRIWESPDVCVAVGMGGAAGGSEGGAGGAGGVGGAAGAGGDGGDGS
jgi:hypothetical protein